jgi:hypothetical protein
MGDVAFVVSGSLREGLLVERFADTAVVLFLYVSPLLTASRDIYLRRSSEGGSEAKRSHSGPLYGGCRRAAALPLRM